MSVLKQSVPGLQTLLSLILLRTLKERFSELAFLKRLYPLSARKTFHVLLTFHKTMARVTFSFSKRSCISRNCHGYQSHSCSNEGLRCQVCECEWRPLRLQSNIKRNNTSFFFLALSRSLQWCQLHYHRNYGRLSSSKCLASRIYFVSLIIDSAGSVSEPKKSCVKHVFRRKCSQRWGGVG